MKYRALLGALAATLSAGTVFAQAPDAATPAPAAAKQPHRPEEAGLRKADANKDGKVSFDELKAARPQLTQERFATMDTNRDGFLGAGDKLEMERKPKAVRAGDDPDARRQMQNALLAADKNGDAKASFEEVAAAKPGFAKADFDRIDRNKDGFIAADDSPKMPEVTDRPKPTRANAARAKNVTPEQRAQLRERMQKADTNNDGFLTREEARVGMPNITDERFKTMDKDGDGKIGPGDRPAPKTAQ